MEIEVLIFGPAAQAAKADRITIVLDDNASVRQALEAIVAQHPALKFATAGARLAVNQSIVPDSALLHPRDEVALLSLLGGG